MDVKQCSPSVFPEAVPDINKRIYGHRRPEDFHKWTSTSGLQTPLFASVAVEFGNNGCQTIISKKIITLRSIF